MKKYFNMYLDDFKNKEIELYIGDKGEFHIDVGDEFHHEYISMELTRKQMEQLKKHIEEMLDEK